MTSKNIVIVGASGGLGSAFVRQLASDPNNRIYALSRSAMKNDCANVRCEQIDFANEASIFHAAQMSAQDAPLDAVIVATGLLHDADLLPEKSLRDLSAESFQRSFLVNTLGPALVAKHFLPKLHRKQRSLFAALSARVGSIGDNRLGGWYAYRAAKAALNMVIKTASIEAARSHPEAIVVGLHPGTVDTDLAKPFLRRLPSEQCFTTDYAVEQLLSVLEGLTREDTGKVFAWDGREVPW
jgi:NAD(P)-dependent dehydrogenase (short-subunit alcohol dehydrogenase family)